MNKNFDTNWDFFAKEKSFESTPKLFASLEKKIKAEHNNMGGIIITKNNTVIYEKYFKKFNENNTFHVASVTKSVLSALIGIAIAKGFIKNEYEKIADFFPKYAHDKMADITINHLLNMTAPYGFKDGEPFAEICASQNWIEVTINHLGKGGIIGDFQYSTFGAHLLSSILTKATGQSARDFANEFLFTPIGMKQIPYYPMKGYSFDDLFGNNIKGWVSDPMGNSTGGWGLSLSVRDMARFGLLYVNEGIWKDKEIISKYWIVKTMEQNKNNYSNLWWQFKDFNIPAFGALGDGGNIICCIPESKLVIAIASEFVPGVHDRLTLIKEEILPYINYSL